MLVTALLGSANSELGNIVLGFGGAVIDQQSDDTAAFTESATVIRSRVGVATETLTLTDQALAPVVYSKSTSDTLSLLDSCLGGLVLHGTTNDTFSLSESASGKTHESGDDSLIFTETAEGVNDLTPSAKDTWVLSEATTVTLIPSKTVFEKITFTETALAQTALTRQNAETLVLSESADRGAVTRNISTSDSLTLTDNSEGFIIHPADDSITFTDDGTADVVIGVTETLSFSEFAIGVGTQNLPETIFFTETVAGKRNRTAYAIEFFGIAENSRASFLHTGTVTDSITFADETVLSRYTASAIDNMTLFDQASNHPSYFRTYGETLHFTEIVTNTRVLHRTATDTLTITERRFDPTQGVFEGGVLGIKVINNIIIVTPSGTIELPKPEFGDSENTTNDFTLRYGRRGKVYTTVRRRRLNRRFVYTFNLSRRKEQELIQLLSIANDKFMYLTNWKGEQWKLQLLSNPIQSNNIGFDRFRVELEFEGIQLTSGGVNSCQC